MFEDLYKILSEDEAKKLKTYVAFIVDESGSMAGKTNDVVRMINQQLVEVREAAKKTNIELCYVAFSGTVDKPKFWKVKEIEDITTEDFKTRDWTALFDAIGTTISLLNKEPDINDPDTSVLLFVITDGLENHSREFGRESIISLVKSLEDTKRWTFVYLGTDIKLEEMKADLAFSAGNMISVAAASGIDGFAGAYDLNLHENTRTFLSNRAVYGVTNTTNFYSDTIIEPGKVEINIRVAKSAEAPFPERETKRIIKRAIKRLIKDGGVYDNQRTERDPGQLS